MLISKNKVFVSRECCDKILEIHFCTVFCTIFKLSDRPFGKKQEFVPQVLKQVVITQILRVQCMCRTEQDLFNWESR